MASVGDIQLASGFVVVYAFMTVFGFSHTLMTELLSGGWLLHAVLSGLMVLLYVYHFRLSALILFVVLLRVLMEAHGSFAFSDSYRRNLYQRQKNTDPRFDTSKSIDLAFASGNATFEPAILLDTNEKPRGPLLLFPPTPAQLDLIGNNGKPTTA